MMKRLLPLLILVISGHAIIAQNYPIGSRSITFTDPDRNNRSIPTEVYYPAVAAGANAAVAEGEFPVVVFGHGFTMAVGAYQNWWEHLVPLGYIVALPTTEGGLLPGPNHGNFGGDLAFLAAKIQADNADIASPFFGKVRQRAALMGHSMGGGASFLGAANNTNIQCVVGMAPAETNPSAVAAAASITVPSLILYGTEDLVTPEASHSLLIHNAVASSCKSYVRITGGAHCYYANYNFFCATGETNTAVLDMERAAQQAMSYAVVTPFLHYFLYDDCTGYPDYKAEMQTNPGFANNIYGCPNEAPVITENGGLLTSTEAGSYQWYLNGEPIGGETTQTHTYSGAGSYQVGTLNVGTCPVLSNTIVITPTGIVENSSDFVLMQQRDHVFLGVNSAHRDLRAEWYDISGRMLSSKAFGTVAEGSQLSIPKPSHNGLKLLRIITPESQRVFKVF